jgi:hypothetical protein
MIGRTTGITCTVLGALGCAGLGAQEDVGTLLAVAQRADSCDWELWSLAGGEKVLGSTEGRCPRQQIFLSPQGDRVAFRPDKSDGHLEHRLVQWPSLRTLHTARREMIGGSSVGEWVEGDGEVHVSLHVGLDKEAEVEASFGVPLDLGAPGPEADNLHVHVKNVAGTWSVVEARAEDAPCSLPRGDRWPPLVGQANLEVLDDLDKAAESVRGVDAAAMDGMDAAAFLGAEQGGWLVRGSIHGVDETFQATSTIFSCADPACRERVALQGIEPGEFICDIRGDALLVCGSGSGRVFSHGEPEPIFVFGGDWGPRGWLAEAAAK